MLEHTSRTRAHAREHARTRAHARTHAHTRGHAHAHTRRARTHAHIIIYGCVYLFTYLFGVSQVVLPS